MPPSPKPTRKVSCREYYSYHLYPRCRSVLHFSARLFQQFIVDNYIKVETERLGWMRRNQKIIRADLYQGLKDTVHMGETIASNVGKRTVLASSFIGGPRDMYQRYQDAMALVQRFGKPDLFVTVTCNPFWPEITSCLLPGQTAQDRPDLVSRVFHERLAQIKEDLFTNTVLGKPVARVFVIEFQKRGLPHAHILIILDPKDKLRTTDHYDRLVCAELPDPEESPFLHTVVVRNMIHGPCGPLKPDAPCMENGKCKKGYPKTFAEHTIQGEDSYPVYRRRDNGRHVLIRNVKIDNRWIIPYNPYLSAKFNCHINVEICASIKAVKYLYKYIYKGHDRAAVEMGKDEIKQFLNARWVAASEASWRLFGFEMGAIYPKVTRLQLHLPNQQNVTFAEDSNLEQVVNDPKNSSTQLTEFFKTNSLDADARQHLYRDFPEYYVWRDGTWHKRQRGISAARIYTAHPSEGERYYLRLLLNHVRGPTSFEHLRTVNGVEYPTFREAAQEHGILDDDLYVERCMEEARAFQMPRSLRRLFATMLVFCEPSDVRQLWNDNLEAMAADFKHDAIPSHLLHGHVLKDINAYLQQHNKNIKDYDLPQIPSALEDNINYSRKLLREHLSTCVDPTDIHNIDLMNSAQKHAFDLIMEHVQDAKPGIFFVDGPGGTGKTFLYKCILAATRLNHHIALATASSGIAAINLPGGRTAHSTFKIPLTLDHQSMCTFTKQSATADLLRMARIIIWDEAPMTHRHAFEALDKSLRDITGIDLQFGGKIVILGGDFRQVLPVIPRGSRATIVSASISKSYLWKDVTVLRLKENMRAAGADSSFRDFLLRIGDGVEPSNEGMVRIPDSMALKWETCKTDDENLDTLINQVFPELGGKHQQKDITEKAILSTTNSVVDSINEKVLARFSGEEVLYHSADTVDEDDYNLYQPDFLNSLTPNGLPPHKLALKAGAPIICLRNLDPAEGLCNGTRLICRKLEKHVIDAEISTGNHKGKRVFIPRVILFPSESINLPFKLRRKQFPIRLAFALTINKSQGQTIPTVGLYLPDQVFCHGQLYVALSRSTSACNIKVMVKPTKLTEHLEGTWTRNIVYKEALSDPTLT